MSIQTTPFLHLPQWTAEEQPSFLGEINPAWAAIDAGYGDIKTSAGTAITTANAAVNTANAAKSQSQANAGQITQLQQSLEQLLADFNSSATLQQQDVNISITQEYDGMFSGASANIIYNKYSCIITLSLPVRSNLNWAKPTGNVVATIDLPFIYRALILPIDIATIGSTLKFGSVTTTNQLSCTISNGEIILGLPNSFTPVITTTPPAIDVRSCFPIFMSSNSKETIPDNCLFMPA